ncbi:Metalloenzyme, LuxS/M16 peptidase-like protein [Lactarius psammicola]|nr:Metalloenzyme, LuxS/M16 peptidase-like protein [Lactarius psammicola]
MDRDLALPQIQPNPGLPPFYANLFHACKIPPSPACTYTSTGMTIGVAIFKPSGLGTGLRRTFEQSVHTSLRLSEDASVVVGETFRVGVSEESQRSSSSASAELHTWGHSDGKTEGRHDQELSMWGNLPTLPTVILASVGMGCIAHAPILSQYADLKMWLTHHRPVPLRTSVSQRPFTKITTLSNGLTAVTEVHPHIQTITVGVWIVADLRTKIDMNIDTTHFLEHIAFKGTGCRSQHALKLRLENLSAYLNAYTLHEETIYYTKSFCKDILQAVDIISDILQNSKLKSGTIEPERNIIVREQQDVNKQYKKVVFDHLHTVAFQGQSLGCTIPGPKKNIPLIKRNDLTSYIKTNYTADHMVLIGAGGVDHGELVKAAERSFGTLPVSPNLISLSHTAHPKPNFIGSEVHIWDDNILMAHIAFIFGNWDHVLGSASLLSSCLLDTIMKHNLANSYMSFSTPYSDTGL